MGLALWTPSIWADTAADTYPFPHQHGVVDRPFVLDLALHADVEPLQQCRP